MFTKVGVSLLLAIAMFFSTFNIGMNSTEAVYARETCGSIQECEEQIEEFRSRIDDLTDQESELSLELEGIQADIIEIASEIEESERLISDLIVAINELRISIDENLELLVEIEEDISNLQAEISVRMRLAQRVGNNASTFEILSESESLVDFVRRVRLLTHIANTDAQLMDDLNSLVMLQELTLTNLYQEQSELEFSQVNLEQEHAILESAQAELADKELQLNEEIYNVISNRMSEEEALELAERSQRILETVVIPEVNTSTSSGGTTVIDGGGMLSLPMPTASITSEFGPRWGGFHRGIDMSAGSGTSILAAADGIVTIAEWHNDFGWFVVIEHNIDGTRLGTLYAHMRYSPPVSPGQEVSQGQTIGTQGNTGLSFGDHLHFEVHPGGWGWGRGVNPRNFINFPSRW